MKRFFAQLATAIQQTVGVFNFKLQIWLLPVAIALSYALAPVVVIGAIYFVLYLVENDSSTALLRAEAHALELFRKETLPITSYFPTIYSAIIDYRFWWLPVAFVYCYCTVLASLRHLTPRRIRIILWGVADASAKVLCAGFVTLGLYILVFATFIGAMAGLFAYAADESPATVLTTAWTAFSWFVQQTVSLAIQVLSLTTEFFRRHPRFFALLLSILLYAAWLFSPDPDEAIYNAMRKRRR